MVKKKGKEKAPMSDPFLFLQTIQTLQKMAIFKRACLTFRPTLNKGLLGINWSQHNRNQQRSYSNLTFGGTVIVNDRSSLKVGVQSAEFRGGQQHEGVEEGAAAIKQTGFMDECSAKMGPLIDLKDYGKVEIPSACLQFGGDDVVMGSNNVRIKNVKQTGLANKAISDSVAKILREDRVCLTLGGDHSIGIGTVHGASEVHEDLAVLWVDAHCDINTVSTSLTGNINGMTLAFLIRELEPFMDKLDAFSWVTPRIKAKNLAYIGIRDVDPYEREIINKLGIVAYSMREVDSMGIETVTELALEKITGGGKRPLHVSFDIDAIDGAEVPSTMLPLPGGLTVREGLKLMEIISQEKNMVSMDLVEINPRLGDDKDLAHTTMVAKQILLSAFGYYRGGSSKPNLPIPARRIN